MRRAQRSAGVSTFGIPPRGGGGPREPVQDAEARPQARELHREARRQDAVRGDPARAVYS
eukprot:1232779-Lingulodinium_polyedra.AAC.1